MNANGQSHGLLSTLSNLLSSREATRGSWSEPALRSAPIRWGLVAAFALRRMRNARVQAMVFPWTAHRARMGPTKANPLRLIVLGDSIR
jgi:hypothetical protein